MTATGVFKAIAPFLSTAMQFIPGGGPVVAIAAGVLSKVTGGLVQPAAISDVITNMSTTEEGRIKLKEAEMEYSRAMAQLGFNQVEKLEALAGSDRDSARKREMSIKDRMPLILGTLAVFMLVFSILLLAYRVFPPTAEGAILLLVGTLASSYKDVYGYYFGSSIGSDRKTELLAAATVPDVVIKQT